MIFYKITIFDGKEEVLDETKLTLMTMSQKMIQRVGKRNSVNKGTILRTLANSFHLNFPFFMLHRNGMLFLKSMYVQSSFICNRQKMQTT